MSDTQSVWAALLRRFSKKPAWAWLDSMHLVSLKNDSAVLAPAPGKNDFSSFATETRLKQIGEQLSHITGKPVRAVVNPAAQPPKQAKGAGGQAQNDNSAARADASSSDRKEVISDRQAAMELALVRQAFDAFPEARLIYVKQGDDNPGR